MAMQRNSPKIAESSGRTRWLGAGRLFYAEKEVMAYDKLGIGKLTVIQLPMSLCEMFIQ